MRRSRLVFVCHFHAVWCCLSNAGARLVEVVSGSGVCGCTLIFPLCIALRPEECNMCNQARGRESGCLFVCQYEKVCGAVGVGSIQYCHGHGHEQSAASNIRVIWRCPRGQRRRALLEKSGTRQGYCSGVDLRVCRGNIHSTHRSIFTTRSKNGLQCLNGKQT
jgi:hypothetical protein